MGEREPWTMFGYNSREDLEAALSDAEKLGYLRGCERANEWKACAERLADALRNHPDGLFSDGTEALDNYDTLRAREEGGND